MDWPEEELYDPRQGARSLEPGWRWAQDVFEAEIAVELGAFIERYGSGSVRLGPGIHEDHAIYLNDMDQLLDELKEDLLNFEMGHPIGEDD